MCNVDGPNLDIIHHHHHTALLSNIDRHCYASCAGIITQYIFARTIVVNNLVATASFPLHLWCCHSLCIVSCSSADIVSGKPHKYCCVCY